MAVPTTAATPAAVTSPSASHFWLLVAAAVCAAGVIVCDVPLPSVDAVAVATPSPSEVSAAVSPSVQVGGGVEHGAHCAGGLAVKERVSVCVLHRHGAAGLDAERGNAGRAAPCRPDRPDRRGRARRALLRVLTGWPPPVGGSGAELPSVLSCGFSGGVCWCRWSARRPAAAADCRSGRPASRAGWSRPAARRGHCRRSAACRPGRAGSPVCRRLHTAATR